MIEIRNLSKTYAGVHALNQIHLRIEQGEIHALCGENGAGKSTLIKILTGVVAPTLGSILIDGHPLPPTVHASETAGIAALHQESTAFPDLNALDNIFVGREPRNRVGLLQRRRMRREAADILSRLGQHFSIDRPVNELSVAQRQIIAMARALSRKCRLLILDEPTASLSSRETQVMLDIVKQLRQEGVTLLYVSHRLEEIFELADRVTILRDGNFVATHPVDQIDRDQLVRLMVGREVEELTQRHEHAGRLGTPVLQVHGLTSPGRFTNVSFDLRAGEIVGLAGLVGAGRSEIARALFGIDRYASGTVRVDGRPLPPNDVRRAVRSGLALVPEDRQHQGLVLPMSVRDNISLAVLKSLTRHGLIAPAPEQQLVQELVRKLDVRTNDDRLPAESLSGGNQQKVVIAKWLAAQPRALILDEPTRGVDVGAKAQVHRLIRQLAESGLATLIISSELQELLSIADRILVLRQGRISGELDGKTATQEQLLQLALPEERA